MSSNLKRRIMESFKLAEISAVDFPAQQGARARIMKSCGAMTFKEALQKLTGQTKEHPMNIEKRLEAVELALLAKRAEEEYPCLPGTAEEKARILKHLESLPEAEHKAAAAIFKAGDKAISAHYATLGVEPGDIGKRGDSDAFAKCVQDIRKRDKCSRQEAMRKARREHPEEFEAYQN